jgi:hypothetical protein
MTHNRILFIRRTMLLACMQAQFNRTHYSAAESECWDFTAADCLQALGGMASAW